MKLWRVDLRFQELGHSRLSASGASLLIRTITEQGLTPVEFKEDSEWYTVRISFDIEADSEWAARQKAADLSDMFRSLVPLQKNFYLKSFSVDER